MEETYSDASHADLWTAGMSLCRSDLAWGPNALRRSEMDARGTLRLLVPHKPSHLRNPLRHAVARVNNVVVESQPSLQVRDGLLPIE